MKLYLLLLLLPFTNTPITYRQLCWSDFKGKPPVGAPADAVTCTNIIIHSDTAYAVFYPERSWMRTKDSALLRHEQGHFTITNTFAHLINIELKKGYHPSDIICDWRYVQAQYDRETDHGNNAEKQKEWEEKIKP